MSAFNEETQAQLPKYPLDMAPLLELKHVTIDAQGVPYHVPTATSPAVYQPATVAQYALAHWNIYVETGGEQDRQAFLTQAYWLVEHEVRLDSETSCWPMPLPSTRYYAPGPWLSASTQGNAISVLMRAYRLTGDEEYLTLARRAVHTFELDILDGGVSTFLGEDGVFFEEVAVYPAAHILGGYFYGLLGLYDYVALTHESQINELIQRSLTTLHTWIDEYDTGYWSRSDLRFKQVAPRFYHDLHILMLRALAQRSGCVHCAALAERWEKYEQRAWCRWRHFAASKLERCQSSLRQALFKRGVQATTDLAPICVPITAFPVAGGMRSVLAGVAETMAGEWRMEYLTHNKGKTAQDMTIYTFGSRLAAFRHFPFVWFYAASGWLKLFSLLRRRPGYYRLVLAQDGVFTGAFAALAAKMAGVPMVCMDHGTITLLSSETYRAERLRALQSKSWPIRLIHRFLLLCYWPSLQLLAKIATRYTDAFLAAGDDVAEAYRQHPGVDSSKIIQFPFMLDTDRYAPPEAEAQALRRARAGIAADAIVITMIARLAPEKGIDIAIEGISQALSQLSLEVRGRVRVIIAGAGPLESQIKADIQRLGLEEICILWGEATPDDVVFLLGMTDIFLYTATRGINSMAVLEAMAAGCAVIASLQPKLMAKLLADGRGITVPAGDASAVGVALVEAFTQPATRQQMGQRARAYIMIYHTEAVLKRCLRRVLYCPEVPGKLLEAAPENLRPVKSRL